MLDFRGFGERCCGAVVTLGELEAHARECEFRRVVCGLNERDGERIGLARSCELECSARDLEEHRRECGFAVKRCANVGCDWTGSRMHADDHAEKCERKPRPCRHGCGARMTSTDAQDRHEEICPTKEVMCGIVDEADDNEDTRRCPAVMKRNALPRHRDEMCAYARGTTCPDCRSNVAERSAIRHRQTCVKIRRPCPSGCGALVSQADTKLHLEVACPKVEIMCDFHSVGCVARCGRKEMAKHYEDFAEAHVKLLLKATEEVREVSEVMSREVEKVIRDEEGLNEGDRVKRDGVLRAIREEELRALEDLKRLRESEADARKRGELYAQALQKALVDQAETYDAAIAEIHEEIARVREEFEAYKTTAALELVELRQAVDSAQISVNDVSARAAVLMRGGGVLEEHKLAYEKNLARERQMSLDAIARATREIRYEIEDANAEHAREIAVLRDDIRAVLSKRIDGPPR